MGFLALLDADNGLSNKTSLTYSLSGENASRFPGIAEPRSFNLAAWHQSVNEQSVENHSTDWMRLGEMFGAKRHDVNVMDPQGGDVR
jgi:hypothetical protein